MYLSISILSLAYDDQTTPFPLSTMEYEAEMGNILLIVEKCGESGASIDSTTNIESESSLKKRKTMKQRSVAWRHFNKFIDAEGVKIAKCKYCPEEYVADTKNSSASNLLSYILKCLNHPHKADTSQTTLAFQQKGQTGDVSLIHWKFDQEA
nr:uncharacterized protein LOC117279103 isoform X1 [Nicotiana tomentosiformis]